jgi:hypothetical protein
MSACPCTNDNYDYKGEKKLATKWYCGVLADGAVQLLTAPILIGWIWSILFGIALYQKGK